MRARDKPSFPCADAEGLYGCGHCGGYHLLAVGDKLACGHCRAAAPLIFLEARECLPIDDTQARPQPKRSTGKGTGRSGSGQKP